MNTLNTLLGENRHLLHREQYLYGLLVRKTTVVRLLLYEPRPLSILEWDVLFREMDILFEDFMEHLSFTFPSMEKKNVKLCCLLKLGLSTEEMALVLETTSEEILQRKENLTACP